MEKTHRITITPTGAQFTVKQGSSLHDILFEEGVEFPCGGQGRCRGCRVRVLEGKMPTDDIQRERLSPREIADGWRLACQCSVEDDLVIELRQWDAAILANDATFAFSPQEGYGVAVDLGTTTLVAQLVDRQTGQVVGVKTALNPQARYGADVMSRVEYAVSQDSDVLRDAIRHEIGSLIRKVCVTAGVASSGVRSVVIVGNTIMHHLFSDIDLEPMSHVPFEPVDDGQKSFSPAELGWALGETTAIQFLPCLGGFVGSDILAGMLATGIHDSDELVGLIDLGTNGEIVLGTRQRLLCASTAAGPAFEGARIRMGMRASTGAIYKVTSNNGNLHCETLGGGEPCGICGSGLVDAVAAGLTSGLVRPNGRIASGEKTLMLAPPVSLSQADIRQLQLAKGAIAAGVRILLDELGARPDEVHRIYLAGAFGNYVRLDSAQRIGLLGIETERISPSGNTALLGAKMALFASDADYSSIRKRVEHVSLNADAAFQDIYVDEMSFPPD